MSQSRYASASRCAVALSVVVEALLASACDPPAPPPMFRVTVEVRQDGAPVEHAHVSLGDRRMGDTNAAGMIRMEIPGSEGQQVPVVVQCPDGLRSPQQPLMVRLNSVTVLDRLAALRGIVQSVDCPPVDRTVGVVVRTGERPNMSIRWNGREVGRTDASGVAHLTFRAHNGTPIRLEINTSDNPRLHPANPTQLVTVADADDVQVWSQNFEEDPLPAAPRQARRSGPRPPVNRIIRIR